MALTERGKRYLELRENPAVQAMLGTIGQLESKDDYGVIVGGDRVKDFSKHPEQLRKLTINGQEVNSTAAGRYQIIKASWDEAARATGVKDFSPLSQDLAAIYLMDRKGALDDVLSENYMTAMNKLGGTWAKLPSSKDNQNPASVAEFRDLLNQKRQSLGADPQELLARDMEKLTKPQVPTFQDLQGPDPVEQLMQAAWNNRPEDSVAQAGWGLPEPEGIAQTEEAPDDSTLAQAPEAEGLAPPVQEPPTPSWMSQIQQLQANVPLPPTDTPAEEALLEAVRLDLADFRQAALDKFMGRETQTNVKLPRALERAIDKTVALL